MLTLKDALEQEEAEKILNRDGAGGEVSEAAARSVKNRLICELRQQFPGLSYADASAQALGKMAHLTVVKVENRQSTLCEDHFETILNRNAEMETEASATVAAPARYDGDLCDRVTQFQRQRGIPTFSRAWTMAREEGVIP